MSSIIHCPWPFRFKLHQRTVSTHSPRLHGPNMAAASQVARDAWHIFVSHTRSDVYPWLLRRRHSGIGRAPRNPIVTLPAGPPPPPVPPRGGRRTFPRRVARLCMCPTGAGCMRLAREGPWDRETDTATIFPATRCSGCIIATGPGVHPPCECDCAGCMAGGLRSWRLRQAACEAEEDAAFLAARRSSQAAGPSAGTPLLPGSGSAASGSGDS